MEKWHDAGTKCKAVPYSTISSLRQNIRLLKNTSPISLPFVVSTEAFHQWSHHTQRPELRKRHCLKKRVMDMLRLPIPFTAGAGWAYRIMEQSAR
jgi:hypothetical protein